MIDWLAFKTELVGVLGLERDALHIYASVAIQLSVAVARKRGLADWMPWAAVLILAAANEILDLGVDLWPEAEMQAAMAVHDVVNSMILPTVLLIVARVWPNLLVRRAAGGADPAVRPSPDQI